MARPMTVALLAALALSWTALARGPRPDAATTEAWLQANPGSLPHWLTDEELTRLDEIGRNFVETDPPAGVVQGIAEFEPMQGVLIRYPFGLNLATIAALAARTPVTTLVSGTSQENTVRSQFASAGIDLARCSFVHGPTNSYWTRDYGPWYIETENGVAVVDFPYNRPRASDNAVPARMADWLDLDLYGMNLVHTGGNWMCDGAANAASTTLVLTENPGLSPAQVSARVGAYLGIGDYLTIPDPNGDYIEHIDCWAKYLDVDKVLVRRVPAGHPQYAEIEAAAAVFAGSLSGWGTPYEVWRVDTPNNQPYTNSLILNDCVFVPVVNSSWDAPALAVYEAAMPGYEVLGVTGSWLSTDALHCRTRGIADTGLLSLRHMPLHGEHPAGAAPVEARIVAHSGAALLADSLALLWRADGGAWQRVPLESAGGGLYSAWLPLPWGAESVDYYLSAADGSGRQRRHPRMGAVDPHRLSVLSGPLPEPPVARLSWTGTELMLDWSPPAGATAVLVESAPAPQGPWTERATVAVPDSSFREPLPAPAGFYRLRSLVP
jgi:agmatine deiminase